MVPENDSLDSKKRFSSRVENYIKYRPGYPLEIIDFLKNERVLEKKSIIADIGSGTGKLTEIFLKQGNRVYGVEPNGEMRHEAERLLKKYPNFVSINGSAEKTSLDNESVDVITVGQAFHWFNINEAKSEFLRILKPVGIVIIIWNNRKKTESEFLKAYENLLRIYGTDYYRVSSLKPDLKSFFGIKEGKPNFTKVVFQNFQILDFNRLKGRLFSTSYIPLPNNSNYYKMLAELNAIFDKFNENGKVKIEYDTEVYYGKFY